MADVKRVNVLQGFSLRRGYPHHSRCSYTCEHKGSIKLIQWVKNKGHKKLRGNNGGDTGENYRKGKWGMNFINTFCMHIWDFQTKSNNKNNNHGELLMKSYSSLRRFWK